MTRAKEFKKQVRARMEKTGERYTTARAALLGELVRAAPPRAKHDQTFALRRVLAHHDPAAPRTDEAWLLGLGGGISFQYNTFEYSGIPPIVYVGTRCNPQYAYTEAFVLRVATALGFQSEILQTGSAKVARTQLEQALEGGPLLAWVDRNTLLDQSSMGGATPWVVVVHDLDGAAVAVEDCFAGAMEIDVQDFLRAQAALKKARHRLMTVGERSDVDPISSIREGIQWCVQDLDGGVVVGGSAKNFGLAALDKWTALSSSPRDKKGWPRLFSHGRVLLAGIRQVWAWVHVATDGSGFREMYADFLAEASKLADSSAMAEAGEHVRAAARAWTALVADLFEGPAVLELSRRHLEAIDDPLDPRCLKHLGEQADEELDATFAKSFHARLASHLQELSKLEHDARDALARCP